MMVITTIQTIVLETVAPLAEVGAVTMLVLLHQQVVVGALLALTMAPVVAVLGARVTLLLLPMQEVAVGEQQIPPTMQEEVVAAGANLKPLLMQVEQEVGVVPVAVGKWAYKSSFYFH